MQASLNLLTPWAEKQIKPIAWARNGNEGGLQVTTIKVQLKKTGKVVRRKQYPIPMEERIDLKPVVEGLIQNGLLEPCTSPFNTPIIPVKMMHDSYWLVQDLRAINQIVQAKHPVVLNPYTLLSQIPYNHEWFSVIDLKDAFWARPLDVNSRDLFAFEWEDHHSGHKQ
jgi:hypothetical protein